MKKPTEKTTCLYNCLIKEEVLSAFDELKSKIAKHFTEGENEEILSEFKSIEESLKSMFVVKEKLTDDDLSQDEDILFDSDIMTFDSGSTMEELIRTDEEAYIPTWMCQKKSKNIIESSNIDSSEMKTKRKKVQKQ